MHAGDEAESVPVVRVGAARGPVGGVLPNSTDASVLGYESLRLVIVQGGRNLSTSSMSALATTGAVWQIFLESRLASLESVHAWSEGWIEALMDSPQWLIELASATSIADALSVLNGPTGEIDARRVWPECAARLADTLDGDPTTRQMIAQALYFLADDERYVRPEIALEMRSFSDEYTLAEEGFTASQKTSGPVWRHS